MGIEDIYQNVEHKDNKNTFELQTQNNRQAEGQAQKCRGSRCLVLITVSLGLICVLLLVFIILQHFTITAERDMRKSWFFMSNKKNSWSDSRQYCRDRGADLVIINSEEKQRFMSSFTTERVWIGLSDTEQEGNMKWVDNSSLKQGFWLEGEPNDLNGTEDCNELNPANPVLNNWNDLPCSFTIQGICEK
ncbi:C-type lectin domain family 4 member E isoform X2 [Labeo rohita]|uniref:C-type lectin domain family 4 member E isoform X2 n=1 Tax=Labeo rohita TaxID=84645 RepID=UPI0021E28074|nr:C-type lectin domain family 4 member E isoform X2 [Labeo rohita]